MRDPDSSKANKQEAENTTITHTFRYLLFAVYSILNIFIKQNNRTCCKQNNNFTVVHLIEHALMKI